MRSETDRQRDMEIRKREREPRLVTRRKEKPAQLNAQKRSTTLQHHGKLNQHRDKSLAVSLPCLLVRESLLSILFFLGFCRLSGEPPSLPLSPSLTQDDSTRIWSHVTMVLLWTL